MRPSALLLLMLPALTVPGAAQQWRTAGLGATGSSVRLERTAASGTEVLSGVTFGIEGRLNLGRVKLLLAYREGSISPDTGQGNSRDLVEGRAMFTLRPNDWLSVAVGPHARATSAAGGNFRWLFWEGRARVERQVVAPDVTAHLELWMALSASTNTQQSVDGARGGEVALRLSPARLPVWLRLGYTVEHAELQGGALSETLESLSLSVGLGGR